MTFWCILDSILMHGFWWRNCIWLLVNGSTNGKKVFLNSRYCIIREAKLIPCGVGKSKKFYYNRVFYDFSSKVGSLFLANGTTRFRMEPPSFLWKTWSNGKNKVTCVSWPQKVTKSGFGLGGLTRDMSCQFICCFSIQNDLTDNLFCKQIPHLVTFWDQRAHLTLSFTIGSCLPEKRGRFLWKTSGSVCKELTAVPISNDDNCLVYRFFIIFIYLLIKRESDLQFYYYQTHYFKNIVINLVRT